MISGTCWWANLPLGTWSGQISKVDMRRDWAVSRLRTESSIMIHSSGSARIESNKMEKARGSGLLMKLVLRMSTSVVKCLRMDNRDSTRSAWILSALVKIDFVIGNSASIWSRRGLGAR